MHSCRGMPNLKQVTIYTDGACLGNPGPGGYGVVLLYNGHRKELSGGFRLTTNNRMEILAAIKGLEALKERFTVTLYSDSRYLVDSIQKSWARRWKANGWKRNKKDWGRMSIVDTKAIMLPVALHRISVHRPQVTRNPALPAGAADCRRSRCIL